MRRFNILMFFFLISVTMHAQFINNGATVTIQSGATLRIETDIQNNGTGTITNNGTIEVSGNFTNAGTATFNSGTGLVKFISLTGSPTNVTLDAGTDLLHNVEMAKTDNKTVTLASATTIAGDLSFTGAGAKLLLGNSNLTMTKTSSDPITATTDHTTNGYVVTDGTGSLIKSISANNPAFMHEIGDASNYTPLSSAVTGTGYSSATLSARVVDATHPSKPTEADSYLSRYWQLTASGIATYANTLTGTYASAGDATGTPARIKGATYVSPNWSFTNAATNGTSTVTGSTTSNTVDFTGMNALNKVDITAFLASPLSGASMTNTLQEYDPPLTPTLLPTVSPYGAPTTTYSDIANTAGVAGMVTDWVKVEVRDATDPSTLLETRSLLLKTNGHIVDNTGSVPYFKDHSANVRYAIHHRNHLAVLSNGSVGTFEGKNETYNFSTAQTQAVKLDSGDPDQLQLKNGLYCMIPGDVNASLEVDGSDLISVRVQFLNGAAGIYLNQDINLDSEVDGSDLILTRVSFLNSLYSTLANL